MSVFPASARLPRASFLTSASFVIVLAGLIFCGCLVLLVSAGRLYEVQGLRFPSHSHLSRREEALLLSIGGAALGCASVWALSRLAGIGGRARLFLIGLFAAVAAVNGWKAGLHGIYDWTHVSGYLAFVSDSSTGLVGTLLGAGVHLYNDIAGAELSPVSHRRNMFVYNGGLGLPDFALTQGNVVSNLGKQYVLLDHESLHVWQSRAFGPLYQGGYVLWMLGAVIAGALHSVLHGERLVPNIARIAYDANPWEVWAYRIG